MQNTDFDVTSCVYKILPLVIDVRGPVEIYGSYIIFRPKKLSEFGFSFVHLWIYENFKTVVLRIN
jgi:hypothetical protein